MSPLFRILTMSKNLIKGSAMKRLVFKNILEAFDITDNSIVSVVGCNGKTTTMRKIALEYLATNRNHTALLATTTKVGQDQLPAETQVFYSLDDLKHAHKDNRAKPLGLLTGDLYKGMYTNPGNDELSEAMNLYNICVMEADGSRQRPLKAWRDHDLPIHPKTTLTIGILPIDALGLMPTPENTHSFEKFCEVFGHVSVVDAKLIYKMLTLPDQMFKNSPGKKIFFINKCDSEDKLKKAEALIQELYTCGLDIPVVMGSLQEEQFFTLS